MCLTSCKNIGRGSAYVRSASKWFSLLTDRLKKPICPRHPGSKWEVIKRLAAYQLHGLHSALAWFSCDRPHCVPSCDWTGVSLSPLPVIALLEAIQKSQNDCFSLRARIESHTDRKEKVKSCCFLFMAHPGAASKVAYAHRNSNGNVFDEWVCSFQNTNPFPQKETGGGD